MSTLLFRLRGVPDNEARDVRALLTNNEIDYFETPAGIFGISMPAIWLKDDRQLEKAKLLIEEYQEERLVSARNEYAKLKEEGKNKTFIDAIMEDPIRFILYVAVVLIVLYLSTKLFLDIGKQP